MVTRLKNDQAALILLLVLVVVSTACSDPVRVSQPQDVSQLSDSESRSEPGMSRSNPYPTYERLSLPGWDLQVLEIRRGDQARELMDLEDGPSPSPPPGMEYIAVKLFVQCLHLDEDWHDIAIYELFVTGDRGIAYQDDNLGQPAPELYYENFYTAQTMQAWISALVPEDEGNLLLAFEKDAEDSERIMGYIALDEGASILIPANLADISPNEIGKKYSTAAPPGESVITENWKVEVLGSIRGEDALVALQEASENNQPLEEGMEYILVRLGIQYISTQEGGAEIIGNAYLIVDSEKNHRWAPFFLLPRPWTRPWLYVILYPGASYEGWLVLSAPKGDAELLLAFIPPNQEGAGSYRYFSLEP